MHGNDRGLFDPNGAVTRAAVIMTLWNREKNPVVDYLMQFSDVKEGQWYTEAVRWAASEGIIDGYEDGTLRPDRPVNREELTAMLYRYEQYKGGGFTGLVQYEQDRQRQGRWRLRPRRKRQTL